MLFRSFNASSYRGKWLNHSISKLCSPNYQVYVDDIILVWNGPDPPPLYHCAQSIWKPQNSLIERWLVALKVARSQYLINFDDDIMISIEGIEALISAARSNIVLGPFHRYILPSGVYPNFGDNIGKRIKYNMILPRIMIVYRETLQSLLKMEALFDYIEHQEAHCDDILLSVALHLVGKVRPMKIQLPAGSIIDYWKSCRGFKEYKFEIGRAHV